VLHDEQAVIGEFDIYGVYFPAFVVFAAIAFVLQLVMKRLLASSGVYRFRLACRSVRRGDLCNFACRRHGRRRDHIGSRMRTLD